MFGLPSKSVQNESRARWCVAVHCGTRAYVLYVFICVIYTLKSIDHKRVRRLILDLIIYLQISLTATIMWLYCLKVVVIQSYFDVHGTDVPWYWHCTPMYFFYNTMVIQRYMFKKPWYYVQTMLPCHFRVFNVRL